jgi:hypothetical protein
VNTLSTPCLQHCADNNGVCPVHVQVYGMTDEDGVSLNDPLQPDTRKHDRAGDGRTLKVHEATHTPFTGIGLTLKVRGNTSHTPFQV